MPVYKDYTDHQLAVLLKTGDHAAFTEIYDRYWPLLYTHAHKMLHSEEEAMDVVQDIFTMLWTKAAELTFTSSLRAYLYSAVRNQTLNVINRSKLRDHYLTSLAGFMEQGVFLTDEQVCRRDFEERVEREIVNLPPKMRKIFELSRKSGLSHKAIAKELDITGHTVKKTIHRAIKLLRTRMASFFSFL